MRHIIPISGKDSAATALVQLARSPDLPYEFIFCDVRMELPETYAWLANLETTLGIMITRIGKSLEDVIVEQNMLPSSHRRFCTKYGKIFPARDFIGKDEATQYFGIRADESERGAFVGPANIHPAYPLVECGIDLPAVYTILGNRGVLPPAFFWNRLYQAVHLRCDESARKMIEGLKPWDREALFSWRSRSNCFCCFYQRQYEWAGLLEHHPDLFDHAEAIETRYGTGDRRPCHTEFSWMPGKPLAWVRKNAARLFADRVKQVCKIINSRLQGSLWQDDFDPMTVTSCGLYCGK